LIRIFNSKNVARKVRNVGYKSKNKGKTLDKLKIFFSPLKSLPFNDEAAEAYGKIRAYLEKKRNSYWIV